MEPGQGKGKGRGKGGKATGKPGDKATGKSGGKTGGSTGAAYGKDTGFKGAGKSKGGSDRGAAAPPKGKGKFFAGSGKGGSHGMSSDCHRFLQQLIAARSDKLEGMLEGDGARDLWQQCWEEAAAGSLDLWQQEGLATALAKVPFSRVVPPPPLQPWERAMCNFLQEAEKTNVEPGDGKGPPQILAAVEVVLNVVKKVLQLEWEEEASVVKEALEGVLGAAGDGLKSKWKDHRATQKEVHELMEEIDKPWKIKTKARSGAPPQATGQEAEAPPHAPLQRFEHGAWRAPTVDWLRQPPLFTPALLPKMAVPDSKSRGVYESKEEYHDTLERLMIAMTFNDGHAALMPRCYEQKPGSGGTCGNPLLPVSGHCGELTCRSRHCSGTVVLACSFRAHARGLCARCADREKQQLIGQAGPNASTHIYDGVVARVGDVDGKVFIERFASRQPPQQHAIHWKSTKRLQAPNLVGVVHLGKSGKGPVKGRALRPTDPIIWAEIAPHPQPSKGKGKGKGKGKSKGVPEGNFREQGKICLNMLSISGSFDPDSMAAGDLVAIIDCMTFVPEYVPVIKALEQQKVQAVPFGDGAHLNLWASRPTNVSNSVGQYSGAARPAPSLSNLEDCMAGMMEHSTLQPIREIRQNALLSDRLCNDLVQLVRATTLDGGQLANFIDALRNPVHLTQGPPGTGKSYLGVVLIRALRMVEQAWREQNPSVGQRPILVLSYKNHATDEICADYVKTIPSQQASNSWRRNRDWAYPQQSVIRLGGSQHPDVQPYCESYTRNSDPAVQKQRKKLEHLRDASRNCNQLCKQTQLFSSYRVDMFGGNGWQHSGAQQQKQRLSAAYTATEVMLACMVRDKLLVDRAQLNHSDSEDEDDDDYDFHYGAHAPPKVVVNSATSILMIDEDVENGRCRKTQAQLHSQEKFGLLAKMTEGFQHYIDCRPEDYHDPAEMLFQWLKGLQPLPKCQRCHQLSFSDDVPLCDSHRCLLALGRDGTLRCTNEKSSSAYFCAAHQCIACQHPRIRIDPESGGTGDVFCEDHACFHCVRLGIVPAGKALDHPPFNTCASHPLCCAWGCRGLQLDGSAHCEEHTIVQCKFLVRCKGARRFLGGKVACGKRAFSLDIPFCKEHVQEGLAMQEAAAQDSSASESSAEPERPAQQRFYESKQCAGKNRHGKQCGARALPGSCYCHAHAPPDESFAREEAAEAAAAEPVPPPAAPEPVAAAAPDFVDAQEEEEEVGACLPPPNLVDLADLPGYDNQDEVEEEAEGMQHLREIGGAEDDGEEDFGSLGEAEEEEWQDEEDDGPTAPQQAPTRQGTACPDPREWTWDMSLQERWEACEDFMRKHRGALEAVQGEIRRQFPEERKKYQEAMVRANARAYEGKAVIFGTIVGCIGRLEAVRATNPFAILVEEASEVLEPLLYACIGPSTVKFEMIGDHLQLSPSTMQKFDFERSNKIGVSMFERLIRAPPGHEVPNGVLSIQRRMRRDVCDLTREYYKDIVAIEDHEVTQTRTLPGKTAKRSFWSGREIPGMSSHIFLMTHSGAQTKASVGLSKVNNWEAKLAVYQAYYLVACGLARPSIAILTPYKGQLMLMRNMLLQDRSKDRLLTPDNTEKDQVRLSTVDRFQGDEADVVIVSLVVDENSRTPFVKLVNRMIVLLSRARLGMYIFGNVGYFESRRGPHGSAGVEHWMRTLEILEKPLESSDNDGNKAVSDPLAHLAGDACDSGDETVPEVPLTQALFRRRRVGAKMPLCCPQHPRLSCTEVEKPEDMQLGFCKVACEVELSCGHACGMKCHFPKERHEQNCKVMVERPCQRHAVQVSCHSIFENSTVHADADIDTALRHYRCPVKVPVTLPCSHEEQLPCCTDTDIAQGTASYPVCKRDSPQPWVYPNCRHEKAVTCNKLAEYTRNPAAAPKCEEKVRYHPPSCSHSRDLPCHQEEAYRTGRMTYTCPEKVLMELPRCGHKHKVTCAKYVELDRWSGTRCAVKDVVEEGVAYGPVDFRCREKVTFRRKCGHEEQVPCEDAFLWAANGPPLCAKVVPHRSPYCQHTCEIMCHEAVKLAGIAPSVSQPLEEVHEGMMPKMPAGLPRAMTDCKAEVTVHRRCGHKEKMPCGAASRILSKCTVAAPMKSPLCGHEVSVPCHLQASMKQLLLWDDAVLQALAGEGRLPRGSRPQGYVPVDPSLLSCLKSCKKRLLAERSCGHGVQMNCAELLKVVADAGEIAKGTKCPEMVERLCEKCGSASKQQCSKWKQIDEGALKFECRGKRTLPCWNVAACGSLSVLVPCSCEEGAAICCDRLVQWECPAGRHKLRLPLCAKGQPKACRQCEIDTLEADAAAAEKHAAAAAANDPSPLPHHLDAKQPPPGGLLSVISQLFTGPEDAPVSSPGIQAAQRCVLSLKGKAVELTAESKMKEMLWKGHSGSLRARAMRLKSNKTGEGQGFLHLTVPIFFEVTDQKKQATGFSFDGAFIKPTTLGGVQVYRFTESNLRGLAARAAGLEKTLLFGYLRVVNALEDAAWPADKKSKQGKENPQKKFQSYDCVEFGPERGMRRLVVFSPFPLYATHRLGPLSKEDLEQLAADLGTSPGTMPRLVPAQLAPIPPANGKKLICGKAEGPQAEVSAEPQAGDADAGGRAQIEELVGTWAEELAFPKEWDGKDLGLAGVSPNKEQELLGKLSFVNSSAEAFAGKKILEKQLEKASEKAQEDAAKKALVCDLHLLLSLELFSKDEDRAREHFDKYRAGCSERPHPLALLAAARMGEQGEKETFLRAFAAWYPAAADALCTDGEKALLEQPRAQDGDRDADEGAPENPAQLWEELQDEGARSEAMEELLRLTGLRKVKLAAVRLFKTGLAFARMDAEMRALNAPSLNYSFLGNPGTGKTTVARLFARILHDSGLRGGSAFEECTAQKLKEEGPEEFRKRAANAKDGVLFIDEAYDLDPVGDRFKGAPVANEIVTTAENSRQHLSIIVAGYEDDMNEKFFAYNPGLKSRFTEVAFEDFDEKELLEVWEGTLQKRRLAADQRLGRVVARRLAKVAGSKGFGNARAVRQKVDEAFARMTVRPDFDASSLVLEPCDVVGENPARSAKLQAVLAEVEGKVGWEKVKRSLRELVEVRSSNYERELDGQPALDVFLNRLFLGNPGTGKTTCAKLYGQVLKHLGLLSNGDVVDKSASDLGGSVVGQAQQKTAALLEACAGKVLLIDEAYALDKGQYGAQALDTIVEKVQNGSDIAVLLLGYTEEMLAMLRNQNPGLQRRFDPAQAFYFEDYSSKELLAILQAGCRSRQLKPSLEFQEKAMKKLEEQRRCEAHFGNAGAVENLLKAAVQKAMARGAGRGLNGGPMCLEEADVELGSEEGGDPFAPLEKLYRMEAVKAKLRQLQSGMRMAEEEGEERPALGHFVFMGAPGTGKTTVARAAARILYELKLVAMDKVVETSGLSLTGEYVGQTKKKVEEKLDEAKGGVLFIDEAYELRKGQFGSEACTALVAAMTDPRYAGLTIILAGYQADMMSMLDTNEGLKSRVQHFLEFPDWRAGDCSECFLKKARDGNFSFDAAALGGLLAKGFERLLPLKGWGNARDVQKAWEMTMQARAERIYSAGAESNGEKALEVADIKAAIDGLLAARMGSGGMSRDSSDSSDPFAALDRLYRMEAVKEKLKQLQATYEIAEKDGEDPPPVGHFVFSGAPGTGKTTVARATANILFRLGLINRNNVVETSGLNMTGQYVGQTKTKVEEQLNKANGGVLFIDEAYELGKGQYGGEACSALVAAMTDPQYASLVIILAGYQADMDEMLNTNPGLKSRVRHFMQFPDWAASDCVQRFKDKAQAEGFSFTCSNETVEQILGKNFEKLLPLEGWGNARDVEKVWSEAKSQRAQRLVAAGGEAAKSFSPEDLRAAIEGLVASRMGTTSVARGPKGDSDPFEALAGLYGMDHVVKKLRQLQSTYLMAQREGEAAPDLGHFAFVGNPGTGKTTVARAVAGVLFRLELVARDHVVETSGLSLTGEYLGHTKKKVAAELDKAKGGVLFIDEAYELGKGPFGIEACTALVAAMTDPRYSGVVIIIAGYPGDISAMLDSNVGLKSRFQHFLNFPDWTHQDCASFFKESAAKKGLELAAGVEAMVEEGFARLAGLPGWGNARDVNEVWKACMRERASRVIDMPDSDASRSLVAEDVSVAFEEKVRARETCPRSDWARDVPPPPPPAMAMPRTRRPHGTAVPAERHAPAEQHAPQELSATPPPEPMQEEGEAEEQAVLQAAEAQEAPSPVSSAEAEARDDGVPEEVWAELQMAKEQQRQREAERLAEQEELQRREEEERQRLAAEQERLRLLEEERAREEALHRAWEEHKARLLALQRAREEAEERRREEARKKEAIQERLRRISPCPAGFHWYQTGGGWRCGGGSHFVSDAELNRSFTH